jgi:hypothetical protein
MVFVARLEWLQSNHLEYIHGGKKEAPIHAKVGQKVFSMAKSCPNKIKHLYYVKCTIQGHHCICNITDFHCQ